MSIYTDQINKLYRQAKRFRKARIESFSQVDDRQARFNRSKLDAR